MDLIRNASNASTMFEETNTELKREYLKNYIDLYNEITSSLPGYKGSFGTGYPFYALGKDLEGKLPVIEEQIRYNYDLIKDLHEYIIQPNYYYDKNRIWNCEVCLAENGSSMPNLKTICKRCPEVHEKLRPRKIINRLPDIDLWMVIEDGYEDVTKKKLINLFEKHNLHTSDVDPIGTINKVYNIAKELKEGKMPTEYIPLDTHLVTYDNLYSLIDKTPYEMDKAKKDGRIPYIPILPESLRKTWQYDDEAYNFIHDYLYAFTEYNFESNLLKRLKETRKEIADKYTNGELERIAILTGSKSVSKRQENFVLKKRFDERINLWREE